MTMADCCLTNNLCELDFIRSMLQAIITVLEARSEQHRYYTCTSITMLLPSTCI